MEGFTPAEQDIRDANAARELTAPRPVPDPRQRYIDGMRVLMTILEQNPDLPLPYEGDMSAMTFHFLHAANPREEMAAAARAIPCGNWRKRVTEATADFPAYFNFDGELAGVRVKLAAFRDDVCERVVTGTHEETVKVKDPEKLAEVPVITVTKVVEDVEWICGPVTRPAAKAVAAA